MVNALKTKKELIQELETALGRLSEVERMKEALRASEEKFAGIFRYSPMGLSLTRLKDNTILEINDSYSAFTGYSRQEIIGRNVNELNIWADPKDRERMLTLMKERGRVANKEFYLHVKSGAVHPVLMSAERVKVGGEDCLLVMALDITERKQVEDELRESEEFTSSLLQGTPHPVVVLNPDKSIKYVNPAFEKLTGFTITDVIGNKPPYPWWPEETKAEIGAILKQTSFQDSLKTELVYRKKNGERFWVEVSATTIEKRGERRYTLINWIDITERRQAEEALRFSDTAFKSIHESIIAVDIKNIITYWNDISADLFGVNASAAIGKNLFNILRAKETYPGQIAELAQRLRDHGFNRNEMLYTTPRGEFWIDMTIQRIKRDGQDQGLILTALDITDRKKAEEALKDSERKYASLVENSSDGIIIIQNRVVKYINSKMVEMYGYPKEEVIGKIFVNIIAEEQREMVSTLNRKRLAGEEVPQKYEFDIINKKGERLNMVINASPIEFQGRPADMATIRDITGSKRAEEALKDSEEKFSKAFNTSANAICIISLPDNKFVEINEGYTRFTGYTREETIGHTATELNLWVNPKDYIQVQTKTSGKGKTTNLEFYSRMKSGEIRAGLSSSEEINIGGKACRLVVITDITDRKKAEEALKDSEEKFSKAFNTSANAICITSFKDGRFIDVNESFSRFTDYTREELIGHTATELGLWLMPEDPESAQRLVESKGVFSNLGYQSRRKTGEIRTVLASSEAITIKGEPCLIAVITDITERKKAEEALKDSEEKFSKVFHGSPNPFCIVSIEEEKFIDINESYSRFTGYTREETIGHTSAELGLWVNEDDLKTLRNVLIQKGRIINLQVASRIKSGEIRTVLFSAEIVNIAGRRRMILTITDITDREKTEEALKETEEFNSTLLTNTPDAIFVTYPDGTIKYANPAFEKLTGFTLAEIVGMKIPYPWWPSDKTDEIRAGLQESVQDEGINLGERLTKQMTFQKKNGELFTVELNAKIINKNGRRQYILVTWIDITERKKAEEALKESEEKFSKAFSSSANAIGITTMKDNRFVELNESFLRFTGYTREEIIGHSASDLKLWVHAEELKRWMDTLQKDGRVFNQEFSSRTKSGEIRIGLASAEIINIGGEPCRIVVITEITERKKAEEALKNSEENFRHSLDDSPLGIRIVDTYGEPVYINRALLEIYGFSSLEEYQSRPIEKRFTPEKYQEHIKMLKKMASKEIIPKSGETSIVRKDGEVRHLEVLTKDIVWNGKKQYQLLYLDITERKKAEEKLKDAMSNLQQSSARLEAANKELEAFSYSVSHDLRSPLRSIDGFSQALLEDYAGKIDDTGQDYLRRLRNASQKMGELIDGLLRLSRLSRSELRYETVDLGALALEISTRLRYTQPERKVELIIGEDLTTEGDPQLLRALLENLLGNAWKFTGKAPDARIEFGSTRDGDRKTFFVRDNGAGFDMTYVDKLFGAFQRLHDNAEFPGTGIGLATVRRIVNRHGGTVRAEGEVGKGATFYFTLG